MITLSQKNYLEHLCYEFGYKIKSEFITKKQAGMLIGFLIGSAEQPTNLFELLEYNLGGTMRMNTVKAIVLDGIFVNEVYIDKNKGINAIYELLGVESNLGHYSFGEGYTMFWQTEREENTSMEITTKAGAPYPIFIDSKVVIVSEDIRKSELVDIKLSKVKKHFKIGLSFWALVKA